MSVKTCFYQNRCTCFDDLYIEPDDLIIMGVA